MALVFGFGMMLADACNGLLLSWFAQRNDRLARQASRCSSGFIAIVATGTAGAAPVRHWQSGFSAAWDSAGVWVGVSLVATSLVYGLRSAAQCLLPAAAALQHR